jgi:hypothetical protein
VTTVARLVAQVTARPFSTAPVASATRATIVAVCATASVTVAGLTATDATGTAETVMPSWTSVPRSAP